MLKKTSLFNYCFSDNVMKGPTHGKRIENWLNLIGIESNIINLEEIREKYFSVLKKFASKSGLFNRFENNLKRLVYYERYPKFIKVVLQNFKKTIGLSREHSK